MSNTPTTPLLTAWDEFPGAYSSDPNKIQEAMNYCASRFRVASIAVLQTEDEAEQNAMLNCLDAEVVHIITAYSGAFNRCPDVLPGVPRNGGRDRICG